MSAPAAAVRGWRLTAHELMAAGLNSDQAEAVLDFVGEATLTRGRGWRLDGEVYRMAPGVAEVELVNDSRVACVHVDASGRLKEV